MIIKCSIAGTLELNHLGLTLHGGDTIDLHSIFKPEQVTKEMQPPDGCLFQAFQEGWIKIIKYNSNEFLQYQKNQEVELEKKIKASIKENSIKLLVNYYKKNINDKIKFVNDLTYSYYDFLLEVKNNERENEVVYAIHKKLADFSERRIIEGFILI